MVLPAYIYRLTAKTMWGQHVAQIGETTECVRAADAEYEQTAPESERHTYKQHGLSQFRGSHDAAISVGNDKRAQESQHLLQRGIARPMRQGSSCLRALG